MKKNLFCSLFALMFAFILSNTATANEVFDKNCASCHAGGNNIMNPEKTLTQESLEKNGVNNLEAIKALVAKGNGPMPAFSASLDAGQIDSVAAYVLEQAKKGW